MGSVVSEKQTTLNCGTAALLFIGGGSSYEKIEIILVFSEKFLKTLERIL